MRINSYNKFFAKVAEIMNTSIKDVEQLDGGYMNVNLTTIHPYNGKGFVRVVPCYYNGKPSTKYMTIQYWVEK